MERVLFVDDLISSLQTLRKTNTNVPICIVTPDGKLYFCLPSSPDMVNESPQGQYISISGCLEPAGGA